MNIMPSISILTSAGAAIGILEILLWYVSKTARLEQAALVKTRFAQLRESHFGAYEKARIDRYLNEINIGRMIAAESMQHDRPRLRTISLTSGSREQEASSTRLLVR